MKTRTDIILIIAITAFLLIRCEKEPKEDQIFPSSEFISEGTYNGEYWPTNGWRSCRPEEVGMDESLLRRVNDEILILQRLHVDIHNVLIIKNGYIVAEQYYSAYTADSLHPIYSCTKSITSALMGIAMDEGYIESVDEKVIDYFPEHEFENPSEQKDNINIENLLTMSAGFEWFEMEYPYDNDQNTFYQWIRSDDRIQFVLDLPLVTLPGEAFNYNTGISHVLSAIIQRSTGIRTDLFAKEHLFEPIGISDYQWHIDSKNIATGGHGLRLSPRDMAKIGYLYLKHGIWEGEQIVPENWIEASSMAHIQRKYIPEFYYGYHWWVKPNSYYNAVGANGQWIFIIPDYDLVVVFTNNINEDEYLQLTTPERLVNTYIIPAVNW